MYIDLIIFLPPQTGHWHKEYSTSNQCLMVTATVVDAHLSQFCAEEAVFV